MSSYKDLYLKYKLKYLELKKFKNQIGGVIPPGTIPDIEVPKKDPSIEQGTFAYIIIESSKPINYYSLEEFIKKNYKEYKYLFKIVKIGKYFGLRFFPAIDSTEIWKVYDYFTKNRYFIDSNLIEFYEPVDILENIPRMSYVFIDNSNIVIGGRTNGFDINIEHILDIINKQNPFGLMDIISQHIIGSKMDDDIIKEWKKHGYEVSNSLRDKHGREKGVDEILHSKISNALRSTVRPEYSNLILFTGDGNRYENHLSFPDIVKEALEKGWTVDLYSWRSSLSINYSLIKDDKFKIHLLDDYEPFRSVSQLHRNTQVDTRRQERAEAKAAAIASASAEEEKKQMAKRDEVFKFKGIRNSFLFIDHSNLIYGAQDSGYKITPNILDNIIKQNTDTLNQKEIVGSGMYGNIINGWEYLKYDVTNVERGNTYHQILHSKIMKTLYSNNPQSSNLIIVSGDGSSHDGLLSFPRIIEDALEKGWTVELYSWRKSTNVIFSRIKNDNFKIHLLDDYEPFISQKKSETPLSDDILEQLSKPKDYDTELTLDITNSPGQYKKFVFIDNNYFTNKGSKYITKIFKIDGLNHIFKDTYDVIAEYNIFGSDISDKIIKKWKIGERRNVYNIDPTSNYYAQLYGKIIGMFSENSEMCKLIIVAGDDNINAGPMSFPRIIELALNRGWKIDLYMWENNPDSLFNKIKHDNFKIYILNDLDPFSPYKYIKNIKYPDDIGILPLEDYSNSYIDMDLLKDILEKYKFDLKNSENRVLFNRLFIFKKTGIKNSFLFVDNDYVLDGKYTFGYKFTINDVAKILRQNTQILMEQKIAGSYFNSVSKWARENFNIIHLRSKTDDYHIPLYDNILDTIDLNNPESSNLIIVSGDISNYSGQLHHIIETALKAGWSVELYIWSEHFSNFDKIKNDNFKIHKLDDFEPFKSQKSSMSSSRAIPAASATVRQQVMKLAAEEKKPIKIAAATGTVVLKPIPPQQPPRPPMQPFIQQPPRPPMQPPPMQPPPMQPFMQQPPRPPMQPFMQQPPRPFQPLMRPPQPFQQLMRPPQPPQPTPTSSRPLSVSAQEFKPRK